MTPELRDYITSITANTRLLAKLVARLARAQGYEQTAVRAESVADDMLDAYNQLDNGS